MRVKSSVRKARHVCGFKKELYRKFDTNVYARSISPVWENAHARHIQDMYFDQMIAVMITSALWVLLISLTDSEICPRLLRRVGSSLCGRNTDVKCKIVTFVAAKPDLSSEMHRCGFGDTFKRLLKAKRQIFCQFLLINSSNIPKHAVSAHVVGII